MDKFRLWQFAQQKKFQRQDPSVSKPSQQVGRVQLFRQARKTSQLILMLEQSQKLKRASNDTAFFVREENQMPATWLLSWRDSWGFISYVGNLLSAASEYHSNLSCARWPMNDHREAAGS